MSHNQFEKRMAELSRLITQTYQAEVATFYNVSKASGKAINNAIYHLEMARYHMDDVA